MPKIRNMIPIATLPELALEKMLGRIKRNPAINERTPAYLLERGRSSIFVGNILLRLPVFVVIKD